MQKQTPYRDKLIAAVKKRPRIWNRKFLRSKTNQNLMLYSQAWEEVGEEVGVPLPELKKLWISLSTQCKRAVKLKADTKWAYYEDLRFMLFHLSQTDDYEHTDDEDCSFSPTEDSQDSLHESAAVTNTAEFKFPYNMYLRTVNSINNVYTALSESLKTPVVEYSMVTDLLVKKKLVIKVDCDKLVELVRQRPIIWNRPLQLPQTKKDLYELNEAWKEVALQLGVPCEEARQKWNELRERAWKEINNNKEASSWELLPKLQFLTIQFNDHHGHFDELVCAGAWSQTEVDSEDL